ncbi:MAG: helix-turn-helix domain-containing protein [Xanthomonadales bacterium]|nr:helix-turn-helix domain-containing protein [Xanthomonadales bacterium]
MNAVDGQAWVLGPECAAFPQVMSGAQPFTLSASEVLANFGVSFGAGSALAYERKATEAAGFDTSALLQMITLHLAPTRAQLADALGVSRQRIYQLLDGESPSAETLTRLQAVAGLARDWQSRHARPLGMILPKPTQELNALWQALAQQPAATSVVDELIEELAARHTTFEEREQQLAPFRTAQQEPGQRGLLPPAGYWSE